VRLDDSFGFGPREGVLLYQIGSPEGFELRWTLPHGDTFSSIAARGSHLYVGTGRGTVRVFDISQAPPAQRASFDFGPGPASGQISNLILSGDLLIGMVDGQIVARRLQADGLSATSAFTLRDPLIYPAQLARAGRYLYLLGTLGGYFGAGSLAVYDLESGSGPVVVGRWSSSCGTSQASAVGGGRAFIDCTPEFGGSQPRQVQVVDLADPAHPFLAGAMALETDEMAVLNGVLYARLSGQVRLEAYDLAQPGVPPRLGGLEGEPIAVPTAYDPATRTGFGYGFDSGGPEGALRYGIVAHDLKDPRRLRRAGYYLSELGYGTPQAVIAGRVYCSGRRLGAFELER